ncbi:MAG: GNAT family N-acetyltransferase [Verrucomicrobiae bacterium]|nr:GNAT family N-acetyltransferase [Verrucomicrobiae bacterium]
MTIDLLANNMHALPIVTEWLFDEWGRDIPGNSLNSSIERLSSKVSTDSIPVHLVAISAKEPVGFGALKLREMDIYPDREHWLGSIYVHPDYRGQGIATSIIKRAISISESFGVSCLSLQTERLDGGLYTKLGWEPVEQVHYNRVDVSVMERRQRTPIHYRALSRNFNDNY